MSRGATLTLACLGTLAILLASAGFHAVSGTEQVDSEASAAALVATSQPEAVAEANAEAHQNRLPAGQGSYPLRWRVSWAVEDASNSFCATAVVVTNLTTATVDVDVEWVDDVGDSYDVEYGFIGPLDSNRWITDDQISFYPFNWNEKSDLGDFRGYALVYANDPRVMVSAYMFCRTGTGLSANLVSITNIPAYPVGTTQEFFQAATPAVGGAPVVVAPESQ